MNTQILTQSALDQLLNIPWQLDDNKVNSHVALFQEYLHRMSLWSKAINHPELWPFYDLSSYLYAPQKAKEYQIIQLKQHLTKFPLNRLVKHTCEWYLSWSFIADEMTKKYQLPDPFAPLILMYERGGTFYTEHGFFCVSVASFPNHGWEYYLNLSPLPDLKFSTLDHLDS